MVIISRELVMKIMLFTLCCLSFTSVLFDTSVSEAEYRYISKCPSSSSKKEIAFLEMNCTDQLLYHCMQDQYGSLLEICLEPEWIEPEYCPVYNTNNTVIDVQPCKTSLGICAEKIYFSNQVLSYSACLINSHSTSSVPDKNTIRSTNSQPMRSTTTQSRLDVQDVTAVTETSFNPAVTAAVATAANVLVVLVATVILIVVVLYRKKAHRRELECSIEDKDKWIELLDDDKRMLKGWIEERDERIKHLEHQMERNNNSWCIIS